MATCKDPDGEGGSAPTLENRKALRFLSNTGKSLENHNTTKPAFNVCPSFACLRIKWCLADGPMIGPLLASFGSSLPPLSIEKKTRKKPSQGWTHSDKTFWIRACASLVMSNCDPQDGLLFACHTSKILMN